MMRQLAIDSLLNKALPLCSHKHRRRAEQNSHWLLQGIAFDCYQNPGYLTDPVRTLHVCRLNQLTSLVNLE